METFIKTLIYIHAFFGGIGLIAGFASIIVKKGSANHKFFGKVFSAGMLVSSLLSLIVAQMPHHKNLFLFLIGIFTIYMILAGNAALSFKSKSKESASVKDYTISYIMLLSGILMVIMAVINWSVNQEFSILYLIFGGLGILMSSRDILFYKNLKNVRNKWIHHHIGKMSGALIASVTAFIVAGLHYGNIIGWLAPTVLGAFYISYWIKKIKVKTRTSNY
ncbi:hypothetical protein [Elizabethkingia anophelis]|uniref:hypothetical protein n=1 Tax=Elizabethkingia anophelis TaxID=1117645 RepID=UPI00136A3F3A|nr:hypothetical protein [Elizabethkingia anophelis]MYY24673.1 hypothetical protein [Elizabethkingia anophelis]